MLSLCWTKLCGGHARYRLSALLYNTGGARRPSSGAMRPSGDFQEVPGYHQLVPGDLQEAQVHPVLFWNILYHSGTSGIILEHSGIFLSILEHS